MGQGKNWTDEEKAYLEDNWGTLSMPTLMANLNRNKNAIMIMVQRLGLGAFLESGDYVTFNQLLKALGYWGGSGYLMKSWVKVRGFPIKYKRVDENRFKVVHIDEFWKWAEKNQSFLDFSRFEENALGMEPDWVKAKRRMDYEKSIRYIKTPWTPIEDKRLERLVSQYKYTYTEISRMMRRTEGAIQRRCCDLGLKGRPLRESPHSKWEDWQFQRLYELIDRGMNYEAISDAIGKSAKAIRGKVYCIYGTEVLDKVREIRKLRA